MDIIPFVELAFTIALFVPVVLLVLAIQYRSHRTYFLVMSLVLLSIFTNSMSFVSQGIVWLNINLDPNFVKLYDVCLLCEIQEHSGMIAIGFLLLSFLHSSPLATIYQWNTRSFLLAIVNAGLLLLLILMNY